MKKGIAIFIATIVLVLSTVMVASAETETVISPTPAPVFHVTYDLVGTTSSNMSVVSKPDASYRSVLKPKSGYRLSKVQILMAGVDITNSVYDPATGVIYIPFVTGDVQVIAKSVKDTNPTKPSSGGGGGGGASTKPTGSTGSTTPGSSDGGNGGSGSSGGSGSNGNNGGSGSNNGGTSPMTGDFVVLAVLLAAALAGGSAFAYKKAKKSK